MNKKGFTLVELLAVVVIIAILASLAVPNIISMTTRAKNEQFITDAKQIIAKAKYYYKNNRDKTEVTVETLIDEGMKLEDSPFGNTYSPDSTVKINTSGDLTFSIYLTDGTYCTKMIDPATNEEIFTITESNLKNDVVKKCS